MMRGLPVVAILLVLFGAAVAAATPCTLRATFDPDVRALRGAEEISVEGRYDTVYFLLLANLDREQNPFLNARAIDDRYEAGFEPSQTTIESVDAVQTSGTVPVPFRLLRLAPALQTYSLDQTVLAVDLPPTQTASLTLRIAFTTDVPRILGADQGIHDGILTWRFGWYPLLLARQGEWVERKGTLELRSGEAFPVEFPAYDYRGEISVPGDYVFVSGVDHAAPQTPSAGTGASAGLTTYDLWNDAPARSLSLVAGLNYRCYELNGGGIPVEVVFLPGHEEAARLFATYALDILSDYQTHYGPYPRERLVIVEAPNDDGSSMAADGIVWLSTLFFSHRDVTVPGILDRFSEFVLAHEIAHQWWGIGIGSDFNAQDWLSEGLAQYLAVTYFEGRYGASGPNLFDPSGQGILENLVRSQFGFLNLREHEIEFPYLSVVAEGFDESVIKPLSQVEYENATTVRLYDKGYLVARAIAAAIGQDVFQDGLREAAAQYEHGMLDVEGLRQVLEKVSGRGLSELFQTWLLESGTVDYSVQIVSQDRVHSGYRSVVRVARAGGTPQPVVVEATLASGKTVRQSWDGAAAESRVTFGTDEPVSRVTIDPDHLLPDRDRLNNNSPVRFVVTSGANVFPLDALVLRPDPTTGGIALTYLNRVRLSLGQDFATADLYQGRGEHLFAEGHLIESNLGGRVGITLTGFAQPSIGSPGTYWQPAYSLTLAAYRVLSDDGALTYAHLELAALPVVSSSQSATVALDLSLDGAGRAEVTASDEAGVVPHVYVQGTLDVGIGFGRVPTPLLFDLEELHSFGQMTPVGWVRTRFLGTEKLFGSLAIEFPVTGQEPFNVGNLLMLDRTRGRLFVAAGMTWSGPNGWRDATPRVEVGGEGLFDLSAIGGLLTLQATLGYASPLGEGGAGVVYFQISF